MDQSIGTMPPVVDLEDLLNKHLQLIEYGIGVKKLFFVFLAVSSKDTFHQPKITYSAYEKHLEIILALSNNHPIPENQKERLHLMSDRFLTALDLCHQSKIEGVNWQKLRIDAQNIFKKLK